MPHFLVFQLFGDFASWGDIAVGEQRPTLPVPTKSAIMGLIAGAMGIRRDEEQRHTDLTQQLHLGMQIFNRGGYLSDYHTTQVPTATSVKNKKIESRKMELECGDLGTILSTRAYWISPYYRITLQGDKQQLELAKKALKNPVFVPYLGRKSCVLGLPLEPQVVEAKTFQNALEIAVFLSTPSELSTLTNQTEFWWESSCQSSCEKPDESVTLRTQISSRQRWTFEEMTMHVARSKGDIYVS